MSSMSSMSSMSPATPTSTGRIGLAPVLAAAVLACGTSSPAPRPRPLPAPVLIVGVDGLEWNVLEPLLREGGAPTFARLLQGGHYGLLATREPALSPRLWGTIATGKEAGAHGIEGFTYTPEGGERRLYTSRDRRTKAFWNILGDFGLSTDTIGWWTTFPAERVRGRMVAQTNSIEDRTAGVWKGSLRDGVAGQVFPPEEEEAVLEILRRNEARLEDRTRAIFGERRDLSEEQTQRWLACQWAFRADSTYLDVALAVERPADVTAVYFGGADVVGHRFWAAYVPERFDLDPAGDETRAFGDVVEDYYRFLDDALGRLLAAWPEGTTLFVISDHGMSTVHDANGELPEGFHVGESGGHSLGEPAFLLAHGTGIEPLAPDVDPATLRRADLARIGDVADFCPTLLAFLGIPIGRDMTGRPRGRLFDLEALGAWPLERVDSHDDAEWLASRSDAEVQPVSPDERIRQLQDLGYLDAE